MAEKSVMVTSATGAEREWDLDADQTLDKIRTKLGKFMTKDDFFADTEGKIVTEEEKKRLSAIVKDNAIVLKKKAAPDPVSPPSPVSPTSPVRPPGSFDTEPGKDPFNSQVYKPDLTPIQHTPIKWEQDHVGTVTGYDGNGKLVPSDNVTQLMVGQQRALLKSNGIDLDHEGLGSAKAFVMDSELGLDWAGKEAVRFSKVSMAALRLNHKYNSRVVYEKVASQVYKAVVSDNHIGFSIPGIFSANASYRYSSATTIANQEVNCYGNYWSLVPKARVNFSRDSISLSPDFVKEVQGAVDAAEKNRAKDLLDALQKYGQFVATDIMLGGRVNLSSWKTLKESHNIKTVEHTFETSARVRTKIEGVPVEGDRSNSAFWKDESKEDNVWQANRINLLVVGGNEQGVATMEGKLIDNWLHTVAKYPNWKLIGFYENSLVPIIDYLEPSLRFRCVKILKDLFTQRLGVADTRVGVAGDSHHQLPQEWTNSQCDGWWRIRKVAVQHLKGGGVIGLIVTSEKQDGSLEEVGYGRLVLSGRLAPGQVSHSRLPSSDGTFQQVGQLSFIPLGAVKREDVSKEHVFTIADDDELCEVQAVLDDNGRTFGLAFKTAQGQRYPDPTHFYGWSDAQNRTVKKISAPRVFELVVNWGWWDPPNGREDRITEIGLRYRELPEDLPSRSFLLAMEPYLFPVHTPYTEEGLLLVGKFAEGHEKPQPDGCTKEELKHLKKANPKGLEHHLGYMVEHYTSPADKDKIWAETWDDLMRNRAPILAFLLGTGKQTAEWLKGHTGEEHRQELISHIRAETNATQSELEALSVPELIDWAWAVEGPAKANEAERWKDIATGKVTKNKDTISK